MREILDWPRQIAFMIWRIVDVSRRSHLHFPKFKLQLVGICHGFTRISIHPCKSVAEKRQDMLATDAELKLFAEAMKARVENRCRKGNKALPNIYIQ